jgi:putative spermidine/putrescine transport system permease protein
MAAPRAGGRCEAGSRGIASYLQAAPLALILFVFLVIPITTIVVVSFWDYDFARIIPDFVLTNYEEALARASPGAPTSTRCAMRRSSGR